MASDAAGRQTDFGEKLVYWLALVLVIVGLLNAMPGIPGIDEAFAGHGLLADGALEAR